MKKSILILFVLLSQVCMGQNNQHIITTELSPGLNDFTLFNGNKFIIKPDYPNYITKTVEYYQKKDSIILSLKNRLDSLEADYDRIMYKLILNEVEKLKK